MTDLVRKNLPPVTPETAEYWQGCRRHELLIQRCDGCNQAQFYPRMLCARCGGSRLRWEQASGSAALVSFTIVHRAVSQAYAAEVPYVVALVRLAEGPTMMSNVVGCPGEELRIGMALQVVFDDWPVGVSVPKFRPA